MSDNINFLHQISSSYSVLKSGLKVFLKIFEKVEISKVVTPNIKIIYKSKLFLHNRTSSKVAKTKRINYKCELDDFQC